MTDIDFRSDMKVELIDKMGGDDEVVRAMLVSTQGGDALDAEASFGRINFLMKNRHGTPFEHGSMQFYVEAPIAVFREWHRHRIGQSYNETSGRYRELPPTFYVPPPERPLVQEGKPGEYRMVPGSAVQYERMTLLQQLSHDYAYQNYLAQLRAGVAKEVARGVLGVYLYTAMVVTMNPRSCMAFLSLRTDHPEATFPSKPMWEIAQCAEQVETAFAEGWPITYRAFVANGRTAP